MRITYETFLALERFGAMPYSGRNMFGGTCLGIVGLEKLLDAIRHCSQLPVAGWGSDSMGKDVVYYNPSIQLSGEAIAHYGG